MNSRFRSEFLSDFLLVPCFFQRLHPDIHIFEPREDGTVVNESPPIAIPLFGRCDIHAMRLGAGQGV